MPRNGEGPEAPRGDERLPASRARGTACRVCRPMLLAIGLAAAGHVGHAQFASRVTLVEVYATVTTPAGRPVVTLTAEDFRVTEDGVPRQIEAFSAGGFPLSVALAIDHSWSMAGRPLAHAKAAARVFLAELRPADESMIIGISDQVRTLAPLSRDRDAQGSAIDALEPWGSTRLLDALLEAHERIGLRQGRRALIVLSDGEDRGSAASADTVIDRVRRGAVIVYPVVLGPRNSPLLVRLAALSGGRALWVRRASDLGSAFGEITSELRHQYLIGYAPASVEPGQSAWRNIGIEVPGRDLRVRARSGYFAWPPGSR